MLEVTDEALTYLLRALDEREAPNTIAMRLSRKSGGLEVVPDQERPGDRGFDLEERTVLVVDKQLAEEMHGHQLCIVENPAGRPELHVEPG